MIDPHILKATEISAYQADPAVHPLTCGRDSTHRPMSPYLEWMITGHYELTLRCFDCDFVQAHIPDIDFGALAQSKGAVPVLPGIRVVREGS